MRSRSAAFLVLRAVCISVALCSSAVARSDDLAQDEELAYAIGVPASIYGYPTMDLYRTLYETCLDPAGERTKTLVWLSQQPVPPRQPAADSSAGLVRLTACLHSTYSPCRPFQSDPNTFGESHACTP